ncbi:hypothetical protein ACP70R_037904 [Stipagrostis hirtigluma subsp. patula]
MQCLARAAARSARAAAAGYAQAQRRFVGTGHDAAKGCAEAKMKSAYLERLRRRWAKTTKALFGTAFLGLAFLRSSFF